MSRKIQFHTFNLLFRLFSYLADKSGGWSMFVRPKLVMGGVIVGLGMTFPEKVVAQKPFEDDEIPPPVQTVFPDSARTERKEFIGTCYMTEMPEYPGGTDQMMNFLGKNIVYPKEAVKEMIEGMVICQFIIDKDGSISDVKVVKTVHPLLDAEAVRVIKIMPKWSWRDPKTAMSRFPFTLPIRFSIPKKKDTPKDRIIQTAPKDSVNTLSDTVAYKKDSTISNNDDIPEPIFFVDSMPEFPKGNEAMMDYIQEHIIYPKELLDSNVKGTVLCDFLVSKEGVISDIKILRGLHPILDKEAVRIIKTFPKWKPGIQGGQAIPVRFTLPIRFSIHQNKK